MQFGEERGNRGARQVSVARRHQVVGGPVGEFNEPAFVHRYDGRGTGFHQSLQSRLRLQSQSAVPYQLGEEQPGTSEGESFKTQANERGRERTERPRRAPRSRRRAGRQTSGAKTPLQI